MENRAVGVIIKDDKILLMQRVKNSREYFCFPGGTVEKGETNEKAAIREIREEVSLDVKIKEFLFEIENQDRKEFYFLINDFSGKLELSGPEKQNMNESNQYYPAWKSLSEFKNLTNFYPAQAKQKVKRLIEK